MTAEALAQYARGPSELHFIEFEPAANAGADVILFGLAPTQVQLPENWVADYAHLGADYSFVYRLPGEYNHGISSVTLMTDEPVSLVAVVMESYVGGAPKYGNFATSSGQAVGDGTLLGTGMHTFSDVDQVYGVWWRTQEAGATLADAHAASVDHDFLLAGQESIEAAGQPAHFIAVASSPLPSLTHDGLILTLDVPMPNEGILDGSARPGMLAYRWRIPSEDVVTPEFGEEHASGLGPLAGNLLGIGAVPEVTGHTPVSGATSVSTSADVIVAFSETVVSVDITVTDGVTPVDGIVSGSGATWTFNPNAPLAAGTTYTVTVENALDLDGNIESLPVVWSFTTAATADVTWGATLVLETAMPGAPESEWAIDGAGSDSVQGFARQFSVNVGANVEFAVHGDQCTIVDIYRIGGYDTGWRKVGSVANTPTHQAEPAIIGGTLGANTCAAWVTTATWAVPAGAWSGLYVAVPRTPVGASWIPFVVRNDARSADVVVKTSELAWALAYNHYGSTSAPLAGKSLNGSGGNFVIGEKALAVSLDRPVVTRELNAHAYWLSSEAPLIRFLEKQGIDYKVVSSLDVHAGASTFSTSKVLVSSGADSYWTSEMRSNVTAFQSAGGHLLFLSGGASFWQVRFTDSNRVMWCYKDAADPVSWTGTWRDSARTGGSLPENILTGTQLRMSEVHSKDALINASVFGDSPIWRKTTVAYGTNVSLPSAIGPQADTAAPSGQFDYAVQVAGTVSNINGAFISNDGYTATNDGNLYWGIVLQRNATGGVVVGFGTGQWQWLLDPAHDGEAVGTSPTAQQALINLLIDMGAAVLTPKPGVFVTALVPWEDYGLTTVDDSPIAPNEYGLMISDGTQWYPIGVEGDIGTGEPKSVIVDFPTPMSTWVIDVGFRPSITVVDSAGSVVEPGSIKYSGTTVTLMFSAAFSGTAYCFD